MARFDIGDPVRLKRTPGPKGTVRFSRTDFTGRWNYLVEWQGCTLILPCQFRDLIPESWLKRDKRKRPPCTR